MPYIDRQRRGELDLGDKPTNTGELNYAITKIIIDYLSMYGTKYYTINDIVGALECSKQEFYRRIAAPHEERKRVENGDVY